MRDAESTQEPTDYVAASRRLYEGQTVDEIFERAADVWRNEES